MKTKIKSKGLKEQACNESPVQIYIIQMHDEIREAKMHDEAI